MKKITLISMALLSVFASCEKKGPKKHEKIRQADWLIGTWENESPQGKMSETWTKDNDSTFLGASYFIKAKDTLHRETIVLNQRGEVLTYVPTVQGQNNNKPIEFKMTSMTKDKLVFENPNHDFPKKITYTKITNDSLVAEISGIQQGKPGSEKYPMSKK